MNKPGRISKVLLIFAATAGITVGVAVVLVSIFEHKQEAKVPFFNLVTLDDTIEDPAVWGKNYPLQYDDYRRTVDMVRTRFGGSEALPRQPTGKDPRTVTSQSKLEEDPRLVKMWQGYAFSVDFREERGHAYMLEDQTYTRRVTERNQPGTCANCHASTYATYLRLGKGDLWAGFDALNRMPYADARKELQHPVACIDCHEPKTMGLRVTRPAFMEGIRNYKASLGVADYQVNRDATRLEMRSYVCGQCHVEYYFKGDAKRLTYPWDKGLRADDILSYYEENGFKDWTHERTGAPMLKAQHPEFETWSNGVHGRAGVACADCHMPYQRVGAAKISDHHIQSPLLNIQAACQTCHRIAETELLARADAIQERFMFSRNLAFDALMEFIDDLEAAVAAGAPAEQLTLARGYHRKASFLLDFVEAENSGGFHADQETMRVLTQALDYIRQGQRALGPSATAKDASAPPAAPSAGGPAQK